MEERATPGAEGHHSPREGSEGVGECMTEVKATAAPQGESQQYGELQGAEGRQLGNGEVVTDELQQRVEGLHLAPYHGVSDAVRQPYTLAGASQSSTATPHMAQQMATTPMDDAQRQEAAEILRQLPRGARS